MEKSLDSVCRFLRDLSVTNDLLEKIRREKIDGHVVKLLTVQQLQDLGLVLGDAVRLKSYCEGNNSVFTQLKERSPPQEQSMPGKRQKLLGILRELEEGNDPGSTSRQPTRTGRPGRPVNPRRWVTVGLRVRRDPDHMRYTQIKSPLGDKNVIRLMVDQNTSYDDLLKEIAGAMFPNNENPQIGRADDYEMSVVNTSNIKVTVGIEGVFSLRKYIELKMVCGVIRFHLLCSRRDSQDSPLTEADDADTLPEIGDWSEVFRDLEPGNAYVNVTESGEVAFRISTPIVSSAVSGRLPVGAQEAYPLSDTVIQQGPIETLITASEVPAADITQHQQTTTSVSTSFGDQTNPAASPITTNESHQSPSLSVTEPAPKPEPANLKDILSSLELNVGEGAKKNHVNVVRANVLDGAYRAVLRKSWDPKKGLSVIFAGEPGLDDGGLQREFLTLAVKGVFDSSIFHGDENAKYLTLNAPALERKEYYAAGSLLSYSLAHGGRRPNCIAPELFNYLVDPSPEFEFSEDALTPAHRNSIQALRNADGPDTLRQATEEIWDLIEVSGCQSMTRRPVELVKHLVRFLTIGRMKPAYDQFVEGLASLNILAYVHKYPSIMKDAFCFTPSSLTAQSLAAVFIFPEDQWSPMGSNKRLAEATTHSFWLDFLQDLEENEGISALQKLLQYATGAVEIPVMGFPETPTLYFRHREDEPWNLSWDYPMASTCAFTLGLPIVAKYDTFKSRFTEALSVEAFTMI